MEKRSPNKNSVFDNIGSVEEGEGSAVVLGGEIEFVVSIDDGVLLLLVGQIV